MSEAEIPSTGSLRHLSETLERLDINFAIVGGVAVALVSTPRYTADIDAIILNVDHRLEWLIDEMGKAGFKARADDQLNMTRRTRVLTLSDSSGINVDLILGLLPFDEDLVDRASDVILNDSSTIRVALPEHLIVMKAIAWRPKDQQDIRELVATNTQLDRIFIVDTFSQYAELMDVPERVSELMSMLERQT